MELIGLDVCLLWEQICSQRASQSYISCCTESESILPCLSLNIHHIKKVSGNSRGP